MTNEQIAKIKETIAHLTPRAESGAQFADICFLATLLTQGPWFNGMTQDRAVQIFEAEYA